MKVKGFKDLLIKWWMGYNFRGLCSLILAFNLIALKSDLKVWNREVLVNALVNKFDFFFHFLVGVKNSWLLVRRVLRF